MPLHGENRAVVAQGLAQMRNGLRPGLVHLARLARLELGDITAENIAFGLAPRLNACGRLGDGLAALSLLLTTCNEEAGGLAAVLDATNEERRAIERRILDEAIEAIETGAGGRGRAIVLSKRGWHQGVIGIVAARLLQRYCKPVVLIGIDHDGIGRGSARGIGDIDLAAAFIACQEWVVQCGGHRAAAGLTIREECIAPFEAAFDQVIRTQAPDDDVVQCIPIDGQVGLGEIEPALLQTMSRLEPFGHANPQPVLCTYGAQVIANSMRELRGGHVRFMVRQGSRTVAAIGFGMIDRWKQDLQYGEVDLAFTPQFNTWRGETTIQLVLKDFRAASGATGNA
jgi:single-stranded-DNA-specific exonuclease